MDITMQARLQEVCEKGGLLFEEIELIKNCEDKECRKQQIRAALHSFKNNDYSCNPQYYKFLQIVDTILEELVKVNIPDIRGELEYALEDGELSIEEYEELTLKFQVLKLL